MRKINVLGRMTAFILAVILIFTAMPLTALADNGDNSLTDGYGSFIDGAQVIKDIISNYGENQHPRIIMTEEKFAKLRTYVKDGQVVNDGSVTAALLIELKGEADNYYSAGIPPYEVDSEGHILEYSKRIQRYVATLALSYNIFGDEKYAKRCYEVMESACKSADEFGAWDPHHFLDTAEMCTGLAYGYDWIYNYMDENQRKLIRDAIIEKGFNQVMNDYEKKVKYNPDATKLTDRSYVWYGSDKGDNWMFVCTGGLNLAALAIGDEADAKDIAAQVLDYGYKKAYTAVRQGYDTIDGTYVEGLGYWDYATYYLGLQSSALISATGTDYGLTDHDGLRKSVDFVRYMSSNYPYSFSFGDDNDSRDTGWPVFLWLGEHYNSPEMATIRLRKISEDPEFRYLDVLWIDESKQTDSVYTNSTDWGAVGAKNASFRNTWDISGLVAALHTGENDLLYHGHFDLGSFYIESNGARFFTDLGNEDYYLKDREYSYRIKPEGHNTLVINPTSGTDQRDKVTCTITDYNSGNEAYAVTDLTEAYGDNGAQSVIRGLKMIKDKECVIIQDEISLNTAGEIYWFAHTKGNISVASDGRSAIVTVGSERMWVGLLSDGGKLTAMDPIPLSTSKNVPNATSNNGYTKLAIHLTNTKDATISVACIPLKSGESAPSWTPSVTALSEWSAPQHIHVGTKVEKEEASCITSGKNEYYVCSCGSLYEDSNCTKLIEDESILTIAALGHDMKPATTEEAAKCSRCSYTEGEPLAPSNPKTTVTVNVEVPGIKTFTLEMQQTDYIGNIKYQLQEQVDIDLNKMDLLYNSEILSEVKRFSSGIIPDGATITMQTSDRWKYDEVNGVDNAAFSIARPKADTLKKIYAKDYGMSPSSGDNTAAFVNALKDCTADTYLVIEPGTYYFRGMTKDIEFNNMENVIIDGNDSTFIFDTKYCMKIYGGNGVEFRNLKVNWDWDTIPVGSLVQLTNKISNNQFEITFIGVDEVDENIPIGTFWYLDPETLTIGSLEKYKAYTPGSVEGCLQKVEKVDQNVLRITHNGNMKHFNEGEYYLLRHFEYSGRVFAISNYAKNITFDNVQIYGFTGMGWVFGYDANHFQIINSYLGLDPNGPAERRISTAADAIHILNTGGYFRISNNDLGFSGDDIINIHDDFMDILKIDDSRTSFRGWATAGFVSDGEVIKFKNSQLGNIADYEATVVSSKTISGNEREIVLAEPLPDYITDDCYVYSGSHSSSHYVISDNYIHEARARAALLNDDYGLFENNTVYRMVSGAVQVRAGGKQDKYFEGEGACHVVVRNNTFEECNLGAGASIVNIGIELNDKEGTEIVLDDVRVEDNVFLNCIHKDGKGTGVVYANNVSNLVVTGNKIVDSGEIILGNVVGVTTIENNSYQDGHIHEGNKVERVDATCTSYGSKEYFECTCGECFEDAECTKKIEDIETWAIIEPLGHDFTIEYDGYDENNHWHICKREGCDAIDNVSAHYGGAASVAGKAVCEACGQAYGEALKTPEVTAPVVNASVSYDPEKTLNDYSLDVSKASATCEGEEVTGSWSWKNASEVPMVSKNTYTATFTPDSEMYVPVDAEVTLNVSKAAVDIKVVPSVSGITYGQAISDSKITDGEASVEGIFAWAADDAVIKPSVSDVEKNTYTIEFRPNDSVNYETATTGVKVVVGKAENAPNMPITAMNLSFEVVKVSENSLPDNWKWADADKNVELQAGVTYNATAVYVGADAGNYANEKVVIAITRSTCSHEAEVELRDSKEATCSEVGYTGDEYCSKCGELIKKGISIDMLPHTGGTATCTSKKICTECGTSYGEVNPDKHEEVEVRGVKTATCLEDGYTGDTYCKACNKLITEGSVSEKAKGHSYESKVTTEPTYDKEGVVTFTCSSCGDTYTEKTDKRPLDIPCLKDDASIRGWEAIKEYLSDVNSGEIEVEMNGNFIVPADVLKLFAGEDVEITFKAKVESEDISWTVNGKDISAETISDVDIRNVPELEDPEVDEPEIDEPVMDEPVMDEPEIDEPVIDEPGTVGDVEQPAAKPEDTKPVHTDVPKKPVSSQQSASSQQQASQTNNATEVAKTDDTKQIAQDNEQPIVHTNVPKKSATQTNESTSTTTSGKSTNKQLPNKNTKTPASGEVAEASNKPAKTEEAKSASADKLVADNDEIVIISENPVPASDATNADVTTGNTVKNADENNSAALPIVGGSLLLVLVGIVGYVIKRRRSY